MSSGKKSQDTGEWFFGIVGCGAIIFGVGVTVFDLMFDPVRSALLSLSFIMLGSLCLMVAVAKFLKNVDKNYFTNKPESQNQLGEGEIQDNHGKKAEAQASEAIY